MKRAYPAVIVIALVAVIAALALHSRTAAPSKVEVGVLLPLSQDFAWWGDSIRDSIELAQADGFMKGAEFIYADTKCDTKDAVSSVQSPRALHPDMRLFIVGCDNDLKAMHPFLDKDRDLAFMVGLSDQSLYDGGFPTINLAYRLESEATAAAEFASKRLGATSLGIMVDDQNFGGTLGRTAAAYFKGIGGKSVIETMQYNERSPDTSILKVLQSHPDAVYIQNDIPGMSAILKRLSQLGYGGKRIAYYGGHDQSLIDTAGVAAEGAYVPWVISSETNLTRTRFEQGFKAKYGKDPFVTAYFVYDGLMLMDKAAASCGTDARCIERYFYDAADFSGTLGRVRYQPNGKVERTFTFQQVQGGKFVDVTAEGHN